MRDLLLFSGKKLLSFLLIFAILIVTMRNNRTRASPTTLNNKFAAAQTNFGLKLYRELAKSQPAGENIFSSPASIALSLTMALNGAGGETREAMSKALELSGLSASELNRSYAQLSEILQTPDDPKIEIELANSLWARQGINFRPQFLEINKQFYRAEVSALDFSDPATITRINSWVSDKTRGKIERIINEIGSDSILFLINAIYFKGKWSKEFAKAKTQEESFFTAKGEIRHPLMRQSGEFQYLENENFQAVSLPYGKGQISMYVLLPKKGAESAFAQALSEQNWESWMANLEVARGEVVLPRFKVKYEATLNDSLKSLGMAPAFDSDRADFSAMLQSSVGASISAVKHKAFCEVNEEGTEAAAATSTEIKLVSIMIPSKTFRMVVNRPFFFAIRHNASGALLFTGSIADPR